MAIKDNITSSLTTDIEAITDKIFTSTPIIICLVYIPPNSSDNYYSSLFQHLSNLSSDESTIIIL